MPWLTLFSCSTAGCRNVRMRGGVGGGWGGGTDEKTGEGRERTLEGEGDKTEMEEQVRK